MVRFNKKGVIAIDISKLLQYILLAMALLAIFLIWIVLIPNLIPKT